MKEMKVKEVKFATSVRVNKQEMKFINVNNQEARGITITYKNGLLEIIDKHDTIYVSFTNIAYMKKLEDKN